MVRVGHTPEMNDVERSLAGAPARSHQAGARVRLHRIQALDPRATPAKADGGHRSRRLRDLPRRPRGEARRVRSALQYDPHQRHQLLSRSGSSGRCCSRPSCRASWRATTALPPSASGAPGARQGGGSPTLLASAIAAELLGLDALARRGEAIYATDADHEALRAAGAPHDVRRARRRLRPPRAGREILRGRRRPLRAAKGDPALRDLRPRTI